MKAKEIVNEILNGQFTKDELASIYNAYSLASKLTREKSNAIALATIKVGAEGKLINIRPKKYIGVKVKVLKVNQKRVEVSKIDDKYQIPFTVPANCIDFS